MSGSYVLGPFRLDPRAQVLFRGREPLALGQRAVSLLSLLVARPGELVTKDSLIAHVWDGQAVEESNLTVQIAALRRQFSAEPGGESWIETFPRRGYRFVGPVVFSNGHDGPETTAAAAPLVPPADMPSIAVLPFRNQNGDPAQDYLAEGFAEDITTALARLSWLVIIARHSSARLANGDGGLADVRATLGVRYVLEGATRLVGSRLRVTCQLSDAETGKTILAQKYEREVDDLFAVQDDITESVVAAIEPHLVAVEGFRAAARPTASLDSWGLVARSIGLIHRFERGPNAEAREHLKRAVEIDSRNARALAVLGWAEYWAYSCFWVDGDERDTILDTSEAHAFAALRIDPDEPWARMVHGFSLSTRGEHDVAVAELRSALSLNPSFALCRMLLGWALVRKGDFAKAREETAKALRLSPVDRFRHVYVHTHGLALLAMQRFDEALPHLRLAALPYLEYMGHLNTLVSCCGHLGLLDEAQALLDFREKCLGRGFSLSNARKRMAGFAHADVFLAGLAKAGVREFSNQ